MGLYFDGRYKKGVAEQAQDNNAVKDSTFNQTFFLSYCCNTMVNIPISFKALVIAIVSISVFSISACKKDSPIAIGDGLYVPPAISIDKTTGYANEVLTISYWNIPELDQYTGQFNGQAVDVYNIGSTLSFLIPNVPHGSYPFKVTADGKLLEYSIQVLEAPAVSNADQLIQDFQTQTDAVFDSLQLYLDNRYGNAANYPTSIQQAELPRLFFKEKGGTPWRNEGELKT